MLDKIKDFFKNIKEEHVIKSIVAFDIFALVALIVLSLICSYTPNKSVKASADTVTTSLPTDLYFEDNVALACAVNLYDNSASPADMHISVSVTNDMFCRVRCYNADGTYYSGAPVCNLYDFSGSVKTDSSTVKLTRPSNYRDYKFSYRFDCEDIPSSLNPQNFVDIIPTMRVERFTIPYNSEDFTTSYRSFLTQYTYSNNVNTGVIVYRFYYNYDSSLFEFVIPYYNYTSLSSSTDRPVSYSYIISTFDYDYQTLYQSAFDDGYLQGYNIGDGQGYNRGYQDAREHYVDNDYSFFGLVSAVFDGFSTFISSLFDYTIFGINVKTFLATIFTIAVGLSIFLFVKR